MLENRARDAELIAFRIVEECEKKYVLPQPQTKATCFYFSVLDQKKSKI